MKTKFKFKQLAIVHFNNCGPSLTLFQSNRHITIDRAAAHLEKTDGFNESVDSLTFVDSPVKESIR